MTYVEVIKMTEKHIEARLTSEVKKRGGLSIKLVSPSMTGLPDRLLLLPGGMMGFVEVKQTRERPRPVQRKRIKQLQNLGFTALVLDDIEDIGKVIDEIQRS